MLIAAAATTAATAAAAAFCLQVTVPEHMNPHANLGHLLAYRVIHPLVNYLSSASPYLPDVTFTQAESCAAATADLLWQKVRVACS
jgi:hypothetical protein